MPGSLRYRLASWIAGRARPISFAPTSTTRIMGGGIGNAQPSDDTLLRENLSTADIATRAIANRISSLQPTVKISRRVRAGTVEDEILDDHPLARLLEKPHPTFTYRILMRLTGQYMVTVGEAYWLKIRNTLGPPFQLQPIPPQLVEVMVDREGVISNYAVRRGDGQQIIIPSTEIIRFWMPDPESLYRSEGYLAPNATQTDAAKFADQHLRSHYQHDATPPSVLKAGEGAAALNIGDARERFEVDWQERYHKRLGTKRGIPAALPTGWDIIFSKIQSGAEIVPLLDYWTQQQLLNFGVPRSILGQVVSGDRSSAETNQFVFDLHTVKPIADLIAEALTLGLASEFDERLFVDFSNFISDDKRFLLEQETADLRDKVRSTQQVLRDRGSDPEDAPWGELPVGTLAQVPYTGDPNFDLLPDDETAFDPEDDDGEEPEEDEEPRARGLKREALTARAIWNRQLGLERQFVPLMQRRIERVFELQRQRILKAVDSAFRSYERQGEFALPEELLNPSLWARLVEPVRRKAYRRAGSQTASLLGKAFIFDDQVAEELKLHAALLVKHADETTLARIRKQIVEAQSNGESVNQITSRIDEVFSGRRRNARTIARTELLRATQGAQIQSYRQSEVVELKQWNDSLDVAVRDSHQSGLFSANPVPVNDVFILANGRSASYPGDASLPPSDSINCRCFVTPVLEGEFQ